MNLIKEKWVEADRTEFLEHLKSFARPEKTEWTRRIVNTKMDVLAILSPDIKSIAKEIAKGDFIGFLQLGIDDYYESVIINGLLIMKIKEFDLMERYLIPFAENAENWAVCDLLSFKATEKNKASYWDLALRLMKNDKPFARRVGIDILFKFILDDDYIDGIFECLGEFQCETEYYVNMVVAWLVAECFAKQREKTLAFFDSGKMNDFTVNKAVSKCRDSFRVSQEDKDMLVRFRRKS